MKIKIIAVLVLLSITAIFFNASIVDQDPSGDTSLDDLSTGYAGFFDLDIEDNVSLHLGSDSKVETIIDDVIEENLEDIIRENPELDTRQYVFRNKVIADESWTAWPKCKKSASSDQSGGKVAMTLWYDLNANPNSVNLDLNSFSRNKINVDLNLNQAKVFFKLKFTRYRCGKVKWTKYFQVEAGKVRVSADAKFNFSGNEFRLDSITNEKVRRLQWPEIESDSKIVDLIGDLVDRGGIVHKICARKDCLNETIVPLLENALDWDSVVGSIANEAMQGIKDKIQSSSSIEFDGINASTTFSLENILLGKRMGASVLVGAEMNLRGSANVCASELNPPAFASRFLATDEKLGSDYSAKLGINFLSGLSYAALKKGLLCQTFSMGSGLPSDRNINLKLRPYGDMSLSSGSYSYHLRKRYTPHRDNIPYTGDGNDFIKNFGTSSALKLTVPVKLDGSGAVSSNLRGEVNVYFLLESNARNDIQLVIKRIDLVSLIGRVDVGGIAIRASDLSAEVDKQLDSYTEVRIARTREYKCHEDSPRAEGRELTEDEYQIIREGQSIYYYETTTTSQNCSNCGATVTSDISFLDFDSGTKKISSYKVDSNGLRIGFGTSDLFRTETSNESECPRLNLSAEEEEDLIESYEELQERMQENMEPQDRLNP